MGLISKATWLGVGYVLGARAGTARYEQIVKAARRLAGRPELQAYLGRVTRISPPPDTAPSTTVTPPAPMAPPVVEPPVVEPPPPVVTVTRRGRLGRRRSS